jgi:hypothetical protein
MMTMVITQKIYTFPDRKLYGEFCATSLLALRLRIVKGEIQEQLCFLDENDRAYCFDEYGVPESHPDFYLEEIGWKLLKDLLDAQMKKRKEKRDK